MWANTFLSPYLHPISSALSGKLCTNAGCVSAYIPSLVDVASIWAAVLQKGYLRDTYRGYSLHPQGGLSKKFSCWNM